MNGLATDIATTPPTHDEIAATLLDCPACGAGPFGGSPGNYTAEDAVAHHLANYCTRGITPDHDIAAAIGNIYAEVLAQLEDTSDETDALITDEDDHPGTSPMRAKVDDFRSAILATLEVRVSDFCADHGIRDITR